MGGACLSKRRWVEASRKRGVDCRSASLSEPDLPDDVRRLLQRHVQTVAELEILLLLHAASRWWRPDEAARELRFAEESVRHLLAGLVAKGFLEASEGGYRFAPVDAARIDGTARLAAVYLERRVAVTTAIHTQPPAAIRAFADAFRIKRE